MILVEYPFSELIENVKSRIRYIVGKRAGDKEFYHTHTACEADTALLLSLADETLTWLHMGLGIHSGGFSIDMDSLRFLLRTASEEWEKDYEKALAAILLALLRDGIIYRWFLISGLKEADWFREKAEFALATLITGLRANGKLSGRRLSPI